MTGRPSKADIKTSAGLALSAQRAASLDTAHFRDGYRWMLWVINILGITVFFFLALLLFILYSHVPHDRFFAQTSDARTMQMVGLDMPNINQKTMLQWASESAAQIMTFGFNDVDVRMGAAQKMFTTVGWEGFSDKLRTSGFLKTLLEEQQLVTAVPADPAMMIWEGLDQGKYIWLIEAPTLVTVRSGPSRRSYRLKVRLSIMRVPTEENPTGIGIDRWISY